LLKRKHLRALYSIFSSKQWLEVGILKASSLRIRQAKVKFGAGFYVVDVPDFSSIVPRHSRPELFFKVRF
jgi:hypothetical protein